MTKVLFLGVRTTRGFHKLLPAALGGIILAAGVASAKTLAVPTVSQMPQDQWCWAASSQAVLSYTGNAPGMCAIVDWVRPRNGWGTDSCCTNPTGAVCNRPNVLWGWAGSVENLLTNWGADSEREGALSLSEVQQTIDDDSPIIIAWKWRAGGGHAVVIRGYSGSLLDIMDPWSGATMMEHSTARSDALRTWVDSLIVRPKKVTFVVDDTGSMGDEIASVRATLLEQIDGYEDSGRFVKYALLSYKDSVNVVGTTLVHSEIRSWVSALSAGGGGDCPEEGYGALDEAARVAPDSEIWWMTDADSHGGFLRMLQTRFRLLLAGCSLHSTILGACTAPAVAAAHAEASSQEDSRPFDPAVARGAASAEETAAALESVSAFTAGRALSEGTGGLFFVIGSASIAQATAIILEETSASALLSRLHLPAGDAETSLPVDASVEKLMVTFDIAAGGIGTMSLTDPDGAPVSTANVGVSQIIAGQSRMLILTPPALRTGTYLVHTSSDDTYVVNASAVSSTRLDLQGDITVGLGQSLAVQAFIPTLSDATHPVGPGPGGPGGDLGPITESPPVVPFTAANVAFEWIRKDGSVVGPAVLFDDGIHGDGAAHDGVFGGTASFTESGEYRLLAAVTTHSVQRVSELVVVVSDVSVSGPMDSVSRPGSSVTLPFDVTNLSAQAHVFDLALDVTPAWGDGSGLPSTLTLAPGERATVAVDLVVPTTAANGDGARTALTVVAQDDPAVTDSASARTLAWAGPLLQNLGKTTVIEGDTLTLFGDFGPDPGVGRRASNTHHIVLGGLRLSDGDVLTWTSSSITVRIPRGAPSGFVFLVADNVSSNELNLIVLPGRPAERLAPMPALGSLGLVVLVLALGVVAMSRLAMR